MSAPGRRGVAIFQAAIVVLAALVGPLAVGAAASATADTPGGTTASAGSSIPSTAEGADRRADRLDYVTDTDAATVDADAGETVYPVDGEFRTVAPNVTVTDEGATTTVDTAKVIVENPHPGDRLTATEQHGIAVSYNASNATLTLSGSNNTMAEVQDVFRSVEYANARSDPSLEDRRIVFSLGAKEPWLDDGATSNSTYHYYTARTDDVNWSTARDYASNDTNAIVDENGYLATVESDAENAHLASKLAASAHLGASDAGDEGNFTWRTGPESGDPLTYTSWGSGEPNDQNGEDYVELFGDGTWNDISKASTNDWTIEYSDQINDVKVVDVGGDAAIVDASAGGTYYESGGPPATVDANLTVTDAGNATTLDAAKVIVENPQAGDRLTATEQHGIDVSYDATTDVLTLNGSGNTVAEFQDVFRTVAFENTQGDPPLEPRRIVFSLGSTEPWTDAGATSASNYHYYTVNTSDRDWSTARDLATDDANALVDRTGYLATVESAAENDHLTGLLSATVWLGASDAGDEGNFTWRTGPERGDPLTYTSWASGEPNDFNGEDYVELKTSGNWNDRPESRTSDWVIEYGNQTNDVTTVFVDDEEDVDPSDLAGNGTAGDPYVITNASELQAVEDDLTANYTLGTDVEGFGTAFWNRGRGFDPLGNGSTPFTGTFDGARHVVANLTVDRPGSDDVGLFGAVGADGVVRNVSVDATVTGDRRVGALVGVSDGLVTGANASGTVAGNRTIGGLVGENAGDLRDVYARSDASGGEGVGGLVGNNSGTIDGTYSAGAVTGDATLGGLVGENVGTVSDGYWDTQASGQSSSAGGTGLTTDEMTGEGVRTNMSGLDFAGPWQNQVGDYPRFDWQDVVPTARDDAYTLPVTAEDHGTLSVPASEGVLANDSDPGGLTLSVPSGPTNGTLTLATNGSFEYDPDDRFVGYDQFTYEVSDGTTTDTAVVTVHVDAEPVDVALADLAGDGGASNPYVITNASELQAMAADRSANYTLGEDVAAFVTRDWNQGLGFDPVGNGSTPFVGTVDGARHAIANLTVDRPGSDDVGLFGAVGSDGAVENVSVDATVTGDRRVGALVGVSNGLVARANASGAVAGNRSIGGLVGQNAGHLRDVYARSDAAGGERVGGLVGYNLGTVNGTYATGTVAGDADLGGLVAENVGTVSDSYWDTQASGLSSSAGGTGLTTAEMTGEAARTNMSGLDFAGPWQVSENDYPRFDWQGIGLVARDDAYTLNVTADDHGTLSVAAGEGVLANDSDPDDGLTPSVVSGPTDGTLTLNADGSFEYDPEDRFVGTDSFTYEVSDGTTTDTATVTVDVDAEPAPVSLANLTGDGSASNPYVITNASELQAMADDLGANYVLGEDVEANVTRDWNGGAGFDPVGTASTEFTGTVDGAGHAVANLTIDRASEDGVALFGYLEGGTVRNVTLTDASVTGYDLVGTLVGRILGSGTVTLASASGTVDGGNLYAGGLVGRNDGSVTASYARTSVTGSTFVGGLVGGSTDTIDGSYATGPVSGATRVGGLVGGNDGPVADSYATGSVTGSSDVGGLVGYSFSGSVTDGYWDTQSTGQSSSAGGTGLTTSEMTGYAAVTNMTGLDFSDGGTWTPIDDDYPVLAWQNGKPIPGDDGYRLAEPPALPGWTLSVAAADGVLTNDTDPDGDALSAASVVSGPTNGTVSIAANGSFTYDADANFAGTDSFTYEVVDARGGLDRATATVTVEPSPTAYDANRLAGSGTASDPYVITNATELQAAYTAPDAAYVLGTDVDASGTADWFGGQGFLPLGNASTPFTGSLAGDAHRVTNLTVDRPGTDDAGLFGVLGDGAGVANLTLANASVTGDERVGGLAGLNKGTITRASATGAVAGNRSVGGLVGLNDGTVAATYARSGATGGDQVGGLVGYNLDAIERSYATGTVTGDSPVGGLVGETATGTVTDAYWDTGASGQATSAGGTGLTTSEMTGLAATTNMTGLAFNDTWWPVTGPDDYPVLVTQTDAYLVAFADPPAEVLAGSNVSLDVFVENVGRQAGSGTVTLAVNGSVVDSATVSLAAGATATVTLNWSVPDGATGDRLLAAASGDDRSEATTTIATYAPLETVWNRTTAGRSQFASPAVGPANVFVGGLDDTVSALNRTTGQVVWTVDRSGSLADSSPAYASGTVYVGSGGGVVYALDASTGAQEWTVTTDSAVVSSPRVASGTVYVGSNDGTVLAIDAARGSVQWTTETGAAVLSRPAVDAGTVYVTTDDGRLLALDAADGSQQWSVDTGTELGHSSPAVAGDTVYVAAADLYAVDASDGTVRWQTPYGGATASTPAVSGGTVYVGAANGDVVALAADTGAIEWTYATGDAVEASPAVVAGRVVVPSLDGRAYLLDAATGSEVTTAVLGAASRSSPTVAGDRAFLGTASGEVWALANLDSSVGTGSTSTATTDRAVNESVPPVVGPDPPDNGTPLPGPEPPGNVTPVPGPEPPENGTPEPGPDPPGNATPGQGSGPQPPGNGTNLPGQGDGSRDDGESTGQGRLTAGHRAPLGART